MVLRRVKVAQSGGSNREMPSVQRNCCVIKWAVVFAVLAMGWGADPRPRTGLLSARMQTVGRPGMGANIGRTGGTEIRRLPKLRIRERNRHLIEDENGKPFFIAGFSPQNIVHWCTPAQMDAYFADRQAKHFNFAWLVVNGYDVSTGKPDVTDDTQGAANPVDFRGNSMLLNGPSWSPKNLNPAYATAVDAMVRSAANHGIYVFLDPFNAAYDPGPADFDPSQHSSEEMRQWGEFWGSRYKNYSHVNFLFGNDRMVSPQIDRLVEGLKKYMPDRLMTTDWIGGPPDWSSDATGPHKFFDAGHRWVNFDGWYEYHAPQWATWFHYQMANPVMPTCIVETFYEGCKYGNPKPSPTIPLRLRQQAWSTVLNGGTGFGFLGCQDGIDDPMKWFGKTPGVLQAQYCTTFFTTRRWYDLTPDWSHMFLPSQLGTPGKDDYAYVSAGLTGDGSLGVCYYPGENGGGFQLTVNMSKLGGGSGTSLARWYDPTNGAYHIVGTLANSGSHTFTTPEANSRGAADWVLVLEKN